ncbi:outer membrane beta-barrel protein [Hymenobacter sp. IS2118]|uniref:outer membrane beta-barrel protein n=1 Tax=Hymenobacter sp. IS2118 TaxID=1505605 RepID=UPI000554B21A|nr:outer membrane beta-barrel protein [Hymenobacter sp. IS2118]
MKHLLHKGSTAAAALLLAATAAQAQVSFGPRVGLNATTLNYDFKDDDEPDSKTALGAQVGLSLNAQFGKLSVQPSLLFTMKGDKAEDSGRETFGGSDPVTIVYDVKQTIRLNYIELPVNLVYSTNGAEGGFQVFAGPYVALGLGGKVKSESKVTITANGQTETESESESNNIKFASEEGDDDKLYLRALDAGFNLGMGYKVGGAQVQLGYGLGLGNLIPKDQDGKDPEGKVRNRGFQLSFAYFFN